jgi:hypothetical protein
VDAVAHETCGPDNGRDQVSQGQQENVAEYLTIVDLTIIEHAHRSPQPYRQSHSDRQSE